MYCKLLFVTYEKDKVAYIAPFPTPKVSSSIIIPHITIWLFDFLMLQNANEKFARKVNLHYFRKVLFRLRYYLLFQQKWTSNQEIMNYEL